MKGGYYFTTGSSFSISSPLHTSYTKNISCTNSRLDGIVTSHQSCQPQQTTTTSIIVPINVTAQQAEIFKVVIQQPSLDSILTLTRGPIAGVQQPLESILTVISVSPLSGPLSGNTEITIIGTLFIVGATTVTVDGVAATSVYVNSDKLITARTPLRLTTGNVSVNVTTSGGTSANNTYYTYTAEVPIVTIVSPASGPLLGGTLITITGTNFTGATFVKVGDADVISINVVSDTSITARTPVRLTPGVVSVNVTTPGGISANNEFYTYAAVPAVMSVSPTSGPLAGGTAITITGTNFTDATVVSVGGDDVTSFNINETGESIAAITPSGSAGTASILVTTPGGTTAANTLYRYAPIPTIASVSPASGPLTAGTSITITGTGLTGATHVTVGGVAAPLPIYVDNDISIRVITPAGSAGTASILVITSGGTSAPNTLYRYAPVPTVTSVSPAIGPLLGNTEITITGTSFTGATSVTVGGVAAPLPIYVDNDTSIRVITPAGSAGTASVLVTTPGGTSADNTLYRYAPIPAIASVLPVSGPLLGGTAITITGTGFTGATAVSVGGALVSNRSVVDDITITATTPVGAPGTAAIIVDTPGGSVTKPAAFTYINAPTVNSFNPSSGPLNGNTQVILTGSYLSGTSKVTFRGIDTNIVSVLPESVTVSTPALEVGPSIIILTTPGGTVSAGSFVHVAAPTVTSVSPASGPLTAGASITITGTGFTGATHVTVGSNAATSISVTNNGTTITAKAPSGTTGTAYVNVTTPGGTSVDNALYTYMPVPIVTGVLMPNGTTPASGPLSGGTTIVINGTGFTGATAVTVGGVAATSVTVDNTGTSITASTLAGSAGRASVNVTTPGGTSEDNDNAYYIYRPVPSVTGVSPPGGPLTGGTEITIAGTDFTDRTTSVTVGNYPVTPVKFVSSTSIKVFTPLWPWNPSTITIKVTTPGGTSADSVNAHFNYIPVPTVTSVSPSSGLLTGNTEITITGTGFTGATSVTVGGVAVPLPIHVDNDTSIRVITPSGSAGTASVVVTTPGGPSTPNTLYRYAPIPTIASVSPASGLLTGNTEITITGTGFTGATSVTVGGVAVPLPIHVDNDTTIRVITPAGSAGTASVVVITPGGTSAPNTLYSYKLPVPKVTSVSPPSGPLAGNTEITITGTSFTGATAVTVDGVAATSVTVDNTGTSITARTPIRLTTGAVSVNVITPGGTSDNNTLYSYTAAMPTVTSVSPASGLFTDNTSITITGTAFTGATSVTVGGVAATSVNVKSDTSIMAITPVGSAGTASVVVTTPGGTSSAPNTLYSYTLPVPTVNDLVGPSGGGTVTLTGTNFYDPMVVNLNGTPIAGTVTVTSTTQATITAPVGSGTKTLTVTVFGVTSSPAKFVERPAVTGVSPNSGLLAGGTQITITGTGFVDGVTTVTVGGNPATSVNINVTGTTITAITPPAGSAGARIASVNVTVSGATSENNVNAQFAYLPTVTNVMMDNGAKPATGSVNGGTTIVITGTGFVASSTVTVMVGGKIASNTSINHLLQIIAVTPPGSIGTVSVNLTVLGATSENNDNARFIYTPPTVTNVLLPNGTTPATGSIAGGTTIVINGTGFVAGATVKVGDSTASITSITSTKIEAVTPPGSLGTVYVKVTVSGVTSLNNDNARFTYTPLTVTNVVMPNGNPQATGSFTGGTTIVINGTGFVAGATVKVGDSTASITSITSTKIEAVTTPGSAGRVYVNVTVSGVTSLNNDNARFIYTLPAPTVNNLVGPAAGGTVTLTGTNFYAPMTVTFGGGSLITATVNNSTRATVIDAPGGTSGEIKTLVVNTYSGPSTNPATYTVTDKPVVDSITPAYSQLGGEVNVTISGFGFNGATAVTIGGNPATNILVISATEITAKAPAGTAGNASVLVTSPAGINTANDLFTYYSNVTTYNYTGANQEFVAPFDCMINSSVAGSAGTSGGNGAVITGNFIVSAGTKLTVVVGRFNSTYAGGSVTFETNKGGGGGYSAVINGPSIGGNVNTNGIPIANEPRCIYIMAGGGGGWYVLSPQRNPYGGLWNSGATPRSKGGQLEDSGAAGYTTDDAGNGAGGTSSHPRGNNGSKFQGGAANVFGYGGGGGYYGGATGGGGSSYVNTSVTDVTSAATNDNAGTVTLTIVQ